MASISDKISNFTSNSISQTSNYKIFIPFLKDQIQYALNIQMPSFSLNNPQITSRSGKVNLTGGDSISYGDITVTLSVGEDLEIYKLLLKHITNCVHPTSGILNDTWEFESGVEITDNSGHPVMAFEFHGCHITSISELTLDNHSDDDEQTIDFSFTFDYFEVVDYLGLNRFNNAIIKS